MLVIENFTKLTGKIIYGRRIIHADDFGWGGDAYVIKFDELPLKVPTTYTSNWEDGFELYLYKHPEKGSKYKLIYMGLHVKTLEWISLDDIKNLATFTEAIRKVIMKIEDYYLNRNS